MKEHIPMIEGEIAEYIRNGSGYIVSGIKSVKLEVTPYKPGIRKARGHIELYPWLKARKGVVNIRNGDDKCFWKCLYRAFIKDKWGHNSRDALKKKLEAFMEQRGFDERIFAEGYTIQTLAAFEERYKISINVYDIGVNGPEETKQYYCSIYDPNSEVEKVDLGIIRKEKGDVHFVIVKKLGAIFSRVNDKNYSHVKMCHTCGLIFKTSERRLQHYKEDHKDETMKKQVLKLPKQQDAWVRFNMDSNPDFSKTLRYFFVCYADFESSNIPMLEMKKEKTKILMRQIPNSYMVFCPDLMFLDDERKLSMDTYMKKFQNYDPYLVLAKFIEDLETIRKTCIFRWQSHPRLPKLTKQEQEKYDAAQVCEQCKKPFDSVNSPKVRHHCPVTGEYKGAWCRRCNYLEGKKKLQLVVFFHNLRGYDAHMILRYGLMEIAKLHGKDGYVRQFIIGKSTEKLSSFQFGNFIFRDSLLHLGCSLERAVDNLFKSNYDFPICEKVGLHPILRRKGIYPYKWVNSVKKFKYTVLPSIEFFHNDLTQEPCSPEDYEHAQNV
jgi:hypothetical protein